MKDANWKRTERAKLLTTQELLSTIKVNVTQYLRNMHVNTPVTTKKKSIVRLNHSWSDRTPMWKFLHLPRSKRLGDIPF